jgi:hypothetical protein
LPVGLDEAIAKDNRPETRVRLLRMDIETTAPLFVTSEAPGVVEVTLPVAGASLPATPEMMVKMRAIASGSTHLQVRFGSATGPIIHQMQVVVSPLVDVRTVAHVPTINGAPFVDPATGAPFPAQSTRSDASIRATVDSCNLIFFPYGIRFVLDAAIDRAGVLNLARQGMVDDLTNEFNRTTALNRVANSANAYFVPQIANGTATNPINRTLGVATSARTEPASFGLLVSDRASGGHVIAHELGHLLNIVNDPTNEFLHIDTIVDPAIPGTGKRVRDDIISRRRLMFSSLRFSLDATRAYKDDVGYGARLAGHMLTIKQLNNDKTDDELREVRRTAAALSRPPAP